MVLNSALKFSPTMKWSLMLILTVKKRKQTYVIKQVFHFFICPPRRFDSHVSIKMSRFKNDTVTKQVECYIEYKYTNVAT